jgi:DNA invertase Pin-like site-specific DNA recombinase
MGGSRRAVGYIRVSDESQADQDKASLPEQERSIREYCQSKGYDLREIFSDVGRRWDADRPEFKRMIAWGQGSPRPFDVIVVWRADGLSARPVL